MYEAVRAAGRCPPLGSLLRFPIWTCPGTSGAAGATRLLHKGHIGKTLEKLDLPRHHWLKEVDQAPDKSIVRRQKDKYLRELGAVHQEIQGLFNEEERRAINKVSPEELRHLHDEQQLREDANEGLRIYRMLRPDAPPFYEEEAVLGMKAKMNKILVNEAPRDAVDAVAVPDKHGDPFKAYLPVVNQRAFLLALESVVASLADDVETLWLLLGLNQDHLPSHEDPLRLKVLMDGLFNAFPLNKDGSNLTKFMEESWPRLKLMMPGEVSDLEPKVIEDWLRGHLRRVRENQQRNERKIMLHQPERFLSDREFYSFAEDFPYDNDPMPGGLADERNLDFPLEKAAEFMQSFLHALGQSGMAAEMEETAPELMGGSGEIASQFQDLVWDLEKIGLRSWLKMDLGDLEKFIPKGRLAELSTEPRPGSIYLNDDDKEVAKLMLRCASRGRADLMDFEAVDPFKLLHDLPAQEIDEELKTLKPNVHIEDFELNGLVDAQFKRLLQRGEAASSRKIFDSEKDWMKTGATVDELYRRELDFYRTAGPVEWTHDDNEGYAWKWRQPPSTFWDDRRQVYIQERKGVDPNLNLKEMRQHMVDITRMGSMVKIGRINYFRAIVVVGNGRGVYGFGVGFGNTPKEARTDGAVKALQNLDYIDMDPGRMMCTPTKGTEYKHSVAIIPRPIGRGLKANKKFLPLLYILGLDNCKVKFMYQKWFTRLKALRRSLDMIISRRTLANMTGKRHALLVAPGDHWVHWPDRWFEEIRKPFDAKSEQVKLARRHALHFKRRGVRHATPAEVKPGWRLSNWARWNHPLERWVQQERKPLPNPRTGELGAHLRS